MVDPLGVVTAIVMVAQLIIRAASTAKQNKGECQQLVERAHTLTHVLPSFAYANDVATARVLERLQGALGKALRLIQSCQSAGMSSAGMFSSGRKAAELLSVNNRINNCIMDLNLISQARANNGAGASTAHAGWAPPTPQHQQAWGTPHDYYQQPPGYVQWVPAPAPAPYYPASPAPSGSNLSSLFTLPTVNKIFNNMLG